MGPSIYFCYAKTFLLRFHSSHKSYEEHRKATEGHGRMSGGGNIFAAVGGIYLRV